MTAPDPPRHLPFEGTRNLRDVGGYPAAGGRRTRWRTLLRSDELTVLPDAAQADLIALGVRQVIDLRWPDELDRSPSVFAGSDAVRYTSLPLLDDDPTPYPTQVDVYRHLFDARASQLADVARALLEPDGMPAVIGCAAGKDRTGVGDRAAARPRRRPDVGHRRGLRPDGPLLLRARDRRASARLAPRAARAPEPARVHDRDARAPRPGPRRRSRAAPARRDIGRRHRSIGRTADRADPLRA